MYTDFAEVHLEDYPEDLIVDEEGQEDSSADPKDDEDYSESEENEDEAEEDSARKKRVSTRSQGPVAKKRKVGPIRTSARRKTKPKESSSGE
jgi:hypothetical protein